MNFPLFLRAVYHQYSTSFSSVNSSVCGQNENSETHRRKKFISEQVNLGRVFKNFKFASNLFYFCNYNFIQKKNSKLFSFKTLFSKLHIFLVFVVVLLRNSSLKSYWRFVYVTFFIKKSGVRLRRSGQVPSKNLKIQQR